jgi:hypothetical protein
VTSRQHCRCDAVPVSVCRARDEHARAKAEAENIVLKAAQSGLCACRDDDDDGGGGVVIAVVS